MTRATQLQHFVLMSGSYFIADANAGADADAADTAETKWKH